MTRRTHIVALLSGALMVLAGASLASASPFGSYQVGVAGRFSDSNMRWARTRIEQNIDMLQRDQRDYGGFRASTIASLQEARSQISLGLAYDNGREDVPPPAGFVRPDTDMYYASSGSASDINLAQVRHNLDNIMDVLQRDNGDYGGHRVAALHLLSQARERLSLGLRSDRSH